MKKNEPDSELPLPTLPEWTVVSVFHRLTKKDASKGKQPQFKHHALQYQNKTHEIATTEHGAEKLREMARLFNKHSTPPREAKIECAADTSDPAAYLRKISGVKLL